MLTCLTTVPSLHLCAGQLDNEKKNLLPNPGRRVVTKDRVLREVRKKENTFYCTMEAHNSCFQVRVRIPPYCPCSVGTWCRVRGFQAQICVLPGKSDVA